MAQLREVRGTESSDRSRCSAKGSLQKVAKETGCEIPSQDQRSWKSASTSQLPDRMGSPATSRASSSCSRRVEPWDPARPMPWWSDKGMTHASPQSLSRSSFVDHTPSRHVVSAVSTYHDVETAEHWRAAKEGSGLSFHAATTSRMSFIDPTGMSPPQKKLFRASQKHLAKLMKANARLGYERQVELMSSPPKPQNPGHAHRWFTPEEMAASRSAQTFTSWHMPVGPDDHSKVLGEAGRRYARMPDKLKVSWGAGQGTSWDVRPAIKESSGGQADGMRCSYVQLQGLPQNA